MHVKGLFKAKQTSEALRADRGDSCEVAQGESSPCPLGVQGDYRVHCTSKDNSRPKACCYLLGCSDYVFSNSFLEDLERLWELRFIIPDPCNPNIVVNEKTEGKE